MNIPEMYEKGRGKKREDPRLGQSLPLTFPRFSLSSRSVVLEVHIEMIPDMDDIEERGTLVV